MNRRHFFAASLALPAWAQRHETPKHPSADEILRDLREGNARFAVGQPRRPHTSVARVHEVAAAQNPRAVVLTCSDSRVPPEVVFDQGIGDLFVIRVAGNVANNDEVASSEYAIEHFGSPVLIVLGHSNCGAVSAVVNGDSVSADIRRMVVHIGDAFARVRADHPPLNGPELIDRTVRENVLETIADLQRADAIAARVRDHCLRLVGAVYNLADGKVAWL